MPTLKSLLNTLATRQSAFDFSSFGNILPNPDPILKARGIYIAVYRDLLVDAHVGACVARRKAAVASLDNGFLDADDNNPQHLLVKSALKKLDMQRLINAMMDGVFFGYQPLEIIWEKQGGYILPASVDAKPPEWFCFDPTNQLRLKTKANSNEGELLPPYKFLIARHDDSYQNPYGTPALSLVYWATFFKKSGLQLWVQFSEKFGSAFATGKLPRSSTDEERAQLLDALDALIGTGVSVIPDDGSIEILEAAGKTASADLYEKFVMFCRSEVSIALLGTNQTTESSSNKASASAGMDVARDLRDGDAAMVSSVINQLVQWIFEVNGFTDAPPQWDLWDQAAQDVLQADRDKKVYDAGARFTNAYFMKGYGYETGDLLPDNQPTDAMNIAPPTKPVAVRFIEPTDSVIEESSITDTLKQHADNAVADLIGKIEVMLSKAQSLEEFQAMLDAAYHDIDTGELTQIMADANTLAWCEGRTEK